VATTRTPNREQEEYWNGEEATHWVSHVDRYDAMLEPFDAHLFGRTDIQGTDAVVDIGCGCGATTLAAAGLALDGLALGIDLSAPMLDVAAQRARRRAVDNVRFERGDAESFRFQPGDFDHALSRFGVMFFGDPVAGFSNIALALGPKGALTFVCWQEMARNDWIAVPGAAVASHVPLLPLASGDAPGPFALSDPDRINAVLGKAGFARVDIAPIEELLVLGTTVEDTVAFLAETGMGRAILANVDDTTRARALAAIADALAGYMVGDCVELGSRAWLVSARI
jgi:SAM-dependent methyltransferase